MHVVQWRRDVIVENTKRVQVVWAGRMPYNDLGLVDAMVMLYSLTEYEGFKPTIAAPGMTHEVSVYGVDPATPVNYDKSLLQQKEVSPLVPARIAFQFPATSHTAAIARIQSLGELMLNGTLGAVPEDWLRFFPDGVNMAQVDPEVEQVRLRLEEDRHKALIHSPLTSSKTYAELAKLDPFGAPALHASPNWRRRMRQHAQLQRWLRAKSLADKTVQ